MDNYLDYLHEGYRDYVDGETYVELDHKFYTFLKVMFLGWIWVIIEESRDKCRKSSHTKPINPSGKGWSKNLILRFNYTVCYYKTCVRILNLIDNKRKKINKSKHKNHPLAIKALKQLDKDEKLIQKRKNTFEKQADKLQAKINEKFDSNIDYKKDYYKLKSADWE